MMKHHIVMPAQRKSFPFFPSLFLSLRYSVSLRVTERGMGYCYCLVRNKQSKKGFDETRHPLRRLLYLKSAFKSVFAGNLGLVTLAIF